MTEDLTGFEAVLLDVDGTLVDSNDAHANAWVDVGGESGIDIRFAQVRALIGMGSDKAIPILAGVERESEAGDRLAKRHGEIFRTRYLPALSPFDGARQLIQAIKDGGLTPVVATSAGEDDMKAILEQAGLADLLARRTSSQDVEDSKPDPDIVRAALKKSGAAARDAIMVGDTPYDIEAARAAGVRAVAFRCGGWWSDEDFAGATWIYDGPAAFLEALRTRTT